MHADAHRHALAPLLLPIAVLASLAACTSRVSLGMHVVVAHDARGDEAPDVSVDAQTDGPIDGFFFFDTRDDDLRDGGDASDVAATPDAVDASADSAVSLGAVRVVALGVSHSCAVGSGGLACWGSNARGQLGDGSSVDRLRPVSVALDAQALALGASHTCALDDAARVRCWGANDRGQVASSSADDRRTPGPALAITGRVTRLVAGADHSCALDDAGAVYCWGRNDLGQLGDGSRTDRRDPTRVALAGRVMALAAREHRSCALDDAGAVYCWGDGFESTPVAQRSFMPASALALGRCHLCVLAREGAALWCAGCDTRGQRGDGPSLASPTSAPEAVMGLTAIDELVAGDEHTCARRGDTLWCFGAGESGQLGTARVDDEPSPAFVGSLTRVTLTMLAAGARHSCVVASGSLACWGANDRGQLGDGSRSNRTVPGRLE